METSSSVLVDKSLYAKRNSSSVPGFNGGGVGINAFLLGSANQRRLSLHGAGVGCGPLGPHPPPPYAPYPAPAPTYSSLPNPYILQQHPHPPLLPLPMSKSLSLPSPSPLPPGARMTGAATAHSASKDQKKPRFSPSNSKKDLQRSATRFQKVPSPAARVPKRPAAATAVPLCEDEKSKEEDCAFTDGVYALSPPPSSLPIPKLFLRPRTPSGPPAASCNAEALVGCGPAADAGASDDLRRLLRL